MSDVEKAHRTSTDLAVLLISQLKPSMNGFLAVSNLSPSVVPFF